MSYLELREEEITQPHAALEEDKELARGMGTQRLICRRARHKRGKTYLMSSEFSSGVLEN